MERYTIAVLGKNVGEKYGKNNFANCLAEEWKKAGHIIHEISLNNIEASIPPYDAEACLYWKKPINIKYIEYRYDPDFIFIEQMYNRFDISEVNCPVIYQHREYTHFPDVDRPDILFGSYPWRLHAFEFYRPWEYHNIPYIDYNLVGVNIDEFKPVEKKIFKGVSWFEGALPLWRFAGANGPWAKMIIEDTAIFTEACSTDGYVRRMDPMIWFEFRDKMSQCEAILIDTGYLGDFGRTIIESMACKTIPVIRIHHKDQRVFYKNIGLTEDMCFFIETPEDVEKVIFTEEERISKSELGLKWVVKNHTYKKRAQEVITKFEEYKSGMRKKPLFMGYRNIQTIKVGDGGVCIT